MSVGGAPLQTVAAEYIWVSGDDTHHDIRSKLRSLPSDKFAHIPDTEFMREGHQPDGEFHRLERLAKLFPTWSFDGSSTGQAMCCKGKGENTEIIIVPKRVWPHPFPLKHGETTIRTFLVLCECFLPTTPLEATSDNTRAIAYEIFHKRMESAPWFAMEQEYVIMDPKTNRPYKWPVDSSPPAQGPYYCSNGIAGWGREIAEEHYAACIKIGVVLSGLNAEVMPAQWEYQVGPCTGVEAGDHAIVARWLLVRVAGLHGLDISFHSKPVEGDWNGSGMHTNYSTAEMREAGGMDHIVQAIKSMAPNHMADLVFYGEDNHHRLTGLHETSSMDKFSYGVGMRNVSCRIPVQAEQEGKGYYEDRRPSSSADPYLVTAVLFSSSMGIKTEALEKLRAEKQASLEAKQ